jgi:hypothetical protein
MMHDMKKLKQKSKGEKMITKQEWMLAALNALRKNKESKIGA